MTNEIYANMYIEETNIKKYLEPFYYRHIQNIENHIDFDFTFIREFNKKLQGKTNDEIFNYLKKNDFLELMHPRQLYNLFGTSIQLYKKMNNIMIKYHNDVYKPEDFLKYFNRLSYEELKNITIREIYNHNFSSSKILFLIFIGDIPVGKKLIEKLLNNNNLSNDISFAFCIHNKILNDIKPIITLNFENFIIYSSNELGNDITPSLLMFDEIQNKYTFDYIVKLHTKRNEQIFNAGVDFILENNLMELLNVFNKNCSCIGYNYVNRENDKRWNSKMYNKYSHLLKKKSFVPATMFITQRYIVEKVLAFVKENYMNIFLQNMYDNNMVNQENSYVHFMERLFGYVD